MNYIKSILIGLAGLIILSSCVQTHYDKGIHAYEHMAYKKASKYLEKYLTSKEDDHDSRIILARSYSKVNDYAKAEAAYAKALEKEVPGSSPIYKFEYAKILAINGKKEDAKKWAKLYLRDFPGNIMAENFIKGLDANQQSTVQVNIIELTEFSAAFSAVPYGEILYFTGERKAKLGEKSNPWNGQAFLDIYMAKKKENNILEAPEVVPGLNTKLHDGPFCFNQAGNKAYLSRSASDEKSKRLLDEESINQLYIYELKREQEEWSLTDATTAINKVGYSSMHPCLSKNGQELYFTSDRPGGQGGFDIYRSRLMADKWSIPENLGRKVNSSANEFFPFMADVDSLYFASNRSGGLGGLDIYISIRHNGNWGEPQPLAKPYNSSADDFAYLSLEGGQKGYLSSNRDKKDQIYSWVIEK